MAETQVQEPEATEAEAETTENGAKRAKTQYVGRDFAPEPLDELPQDEPVGRSRLYLDILTQLVDNETATTHWNPIAHFGTKDGAKSVAGQLNRQIAGKPIKSDKDSKTGEYITKELPEYEGYHWEFAARRVAAPENPDPTHRDSVLYARLVEGPAPDEPVKV